MPDENVKFERIEWVDGFLRVGTKNTTTGERHYFSMDAKSFEEIGLRERFRHNETV